MASTLSPLPPAPSRGSSPSTFIATADAFLAALPIMVSQINQAVVEVENNAYTAEQAAANAVATANASPWNSGQPYAAFDAAISRINYQTYRAKNAVSSTADPANDPTNWAPLTATPPIGVTTVRGFRAYNGVNENSLKMSAVSVSLKNASNEIVVRNGTGNLTCGLGTFGAAGRDQSSAFPSGSEVHFYFIWNGSTLSTLSSLKGPDESPILPAGYTHWAYATSLRMSTTMIPLVTCRGNKVFHDISSMTLSGLSTTQQTSSLAGILPWYAQSAFFNLRTLLSANSSSLATCQVRVKSELMTKIVNLNTGGPSLQSQENVDFELPLGDMVITHWKSSVNSAASALDATLYVTGYTVSNGDS